MVALVLGIVAVLASFALVFGLIVAIAAGITAIVLGRRSRMDARSVGATDTAATAGVALGIASLLIPVLLFVFVVAGRTSVEDSDPPVVVESPTTQP